MKPNLKNPSKEKKMDIPHEDIFGKNFFRNIEGAHDFFQYTASIMLEYMEVLQSVTRDGNFNDSCRAIMLKLYDMEPIDERFGVICKCNNCKRQMTSKGSFSRMAFVMAISFLLQRGLVASRKILLPSKDMIVDMLSKNTMPHEVRIICPKCAMEFYYVITSSDINDGVDTGKSH